MLRTFIIGYDIRDPKRLRKVHRVMSNFSCPIEYSIFLYFGTETSLNIELDNVLALLKRNEDDLRCYELPIKGLQQRIGAPTMPEGIIWTGLPTGCLSTVKFTSELVA